MALFRSRWMSREAVVVWKVGMRPGGGAGWRVDGRWWPLDAGCSGLDVPCSCRLRLNQQHWAGDGGGMRWDGE